MKRWSLFLVTALLLGVPAPVSADKKSVPDPDDVNGALDIKAASHRHGSKGKLVHIIVTHEDWEPSILAAEESWFAMLFDVDRDREDEFGENRYLKIDYSEEEGLHAGMYSQGFGGPGEFIANVPVTKPNAASVRVVFPKKLLARRIKEYRWRAIASYEDEAECASDEDSAEQGGCLDYVPPPMKAGIRHDLR
ncbi:MAG TPA: hypothetical protein VE174_01500 [Actinomycetota bacterium]|nr:hypothetical protein [Actinomycetota bacterium]